MARILAASVAVLIAAWQLSDALTPSGVLLVAAALAVAGIAILIARRPAARASAKTLAGPLALRDRVRGLVVRLLDPGAPGRPRPRAPSA